MKSFELRLCGQEYTINRSDVVMCVEGCYMLKTKKLGDSNHSILPVVPRRMAKEFIRCGALVESKCSNVKGVMVREYRFKKSPYKLEIEV